MAQPEFSYPDFMENNTAEEIHRRMMDSLPDDIDDMPNGFPYDFTKPAALEMDEFISYYLARAVMIGFPQYAWDEWLDLHGQQVHLERHQPEKAIGKVKVTGKAGTEIAAGTVFCTPASETKPSLGFMSQEDAAIGEDGTAIIPVAAVESGAGSNVVENTVTLMMSPNRDITGVTNPEPIKGGTEREGNDDYYDRIAAEYASSLTYLGNDGDYVRWAKEAGAGDCIVIPTAEGPGTVKLVLVDRNGQPANEELVGRVYSYIVSPEDRKNRLLPTACAELVCAPATTVKIDYTITGLQHDKTTDLEQVKKDFSQAVKGVYALAKQRGELRYNDVRPIISGIAGVEDFEDFYMCGDVENISFGVEEYLETGTLDFS